MLMCRSGDARRVPSWWCSSSGLDMSAPENRCSHPDHRRSFLDGNLEVAAHPHRQLRRASTPERPRPATRRAGRAAVRNHGRASSGDSGTGGSVINPVTLRRTAARLRRRTVAARLPAARRTSSPHRPDRPESAAPGCVRPPRPPHRFSEAARRCRPSESWQTTGAAFPRLVRLQVAEKMPPDL